MFNLAEDVNPGHRSDSLESLVSSGLGGSLSLASDWLDFTTVNPHECQELDFESPGMYGVTVFCE